MNVLDLFSGIGGFSLGLERSGMRTVAFCEVDPFCRRVLAKHWPGVPIYDDVRGLTAERLATDGIAADVICGGFPCQDISFAGKGAGIEGERSGLWSEYARIIGELRPQYVIVENVAALLSRGLDRVLGDLATVGLDAEWHCIPASAFGAPHRRDRLWLIGHTPRLHGDGGDVHGGSNRQGTGEGQKVPQSGDLRSALADAHQPRLEGWESIILRECASEWPPRARSTPIPDANSEPEDGAAITWRECSQWSFEPDVGRVAYGVPAELDRGSDGKEKHNQEAGAQHDSRCDGMSDVRSGGQARTASPQLFTTRLSASLVSELSRQGGSTGRDAPDEGDATLRTLRQGVHADTQQEARTMQSRMPRDCWPHERRETMGEIWSEEPSVGRVAHGVANRVDRLRSLGNAVVPQIPEIIGRAIMKAHSLTMQQEQKP